MNLESAIGRRAHAQASRDLPMVRQLSALLNIPTDALVYAYETRGGAGPSER